MKFEDELAKVAPEDRVMVATLVQAIMRLREAVGIRAARPDLVDVAEDIADGLLPLDLAHPHVKGGLAAALDTVEAKTTVAAEAIAEALQSGALVDGPTADWSTQTATAKELIVTKVAAAAQAASEEAVKP
jgi:hypothetical protein